MVRESRLAVRDRRSRSGVREGFTERHKEVQVMDIHFLDDGHDFKGICVCQNLPIFTL